MREPDAEERSAAIEKLMLKLRARDIVSAQEEEVLAGAIAQIVEVPAGRNIVRAGMDLSVSTLLIDGLVCRYKDLADGQRQIMELHLAGDFLDLHAFLLKRLDHHVGSMTPARFAIVPHDRLMRITETHPHLTRLLWFSTLLDSAIHRERILSVGRRDAAARIAHLLCELFVRLKLIGLARDDRYELPITQSDLADASGLTSVHVNRMLKQLRDAGLVTFRGGEVVIGDWDGLQRVAEFDDAFLYLERRPR